MKLSSNEWKTLCYILENRGYRYYDAMDENFNPYSLDEHRYKEFLIYDNVSKRIRKSPEGSFQRYNMNQKYFLKDLLIEYDAYNDPDEDEKKDIASILKQLK